MYHSHFPHLVCSVYIVVKSFPPFHERTGTPFQTNTIALYCKKRVWGVGGGWLRFCHLRCFNVWNVYGKVFPWPSNCHSKGIHPFFFPRMVLTTMSRIRKKRNIKCGQQGPGLVTDKNSLWSSAELHITSSTRVHNCKVSHVREIAMSATLRIKSLILQKRINRHSIKQESECFCYFA